jgi:transposase-like protein
MWRKRPLETHYPLLMLDAIHSKIRREPSVETEATYVVMSLKEDFRREIIAVEHLPIESATGWEDLFISLKNRGLQSTSLIIADGLTGLESVACKAFPMADFQKCVVHLKRNILNKTRQCHKAEMAEDLKKIFVTDDSSFTQEKATKEIDFLIAKWKKTYRFINNLKEVSYSGYYTYLKYDYRIRSMIYTTNWIENFNKQIRRTLKIRNSMPSEESLLLLVSKVAFDKSNKYLSFPIYNFKFDRKLSPILID